MSNAEQQWIEAHPYLGRVAEFQHVLDDVFASLAVPAVAEPEWSDVRKAYSEGAPLLENVALTPSWAQAAGQVLVAALGELARRALPEAVAVSAAKLHGFVSSSPEQGAKAIRWAAAFEDEALAVPAAGLLRVVAWRAIRQTLAPVLAGYAEWRDDEAWMRGYCPVCGTPPAMARILPDATQPRLLVCPCCDTAWQYRRIGCPFCENEDQNNLRILTIDQEPLFRLDSCGECGGYLKTFTGQQDAELHLSDWSTIHLDVLASEQKLARRAPALFEA